MEKAHYINSSVYRIYGRARYLNRQSSLLKDDVAFTEELGLELERIELGTVVVFAVVVTAVVTAVRDTVVV